MKRRLLIFLVILPIALYAQTWDFVTTEVPSKRTTNDNFGEIVRIDGLTAFIAAPGDADDEHENPVGVGGSIYVYSKASATAPWTYVQKIKPPSGSNLAFPSSISANSGYLVVGARGWAGAGTKGGAHVYKRNSAGKYDFIQTLQETDDEIIDDYGIAVGVAGNVVVVTATSWSSGDLYYAGAAYLYEKNESGEWLKTQTLRASDAAYGDSFGASVGVGTDHSGANFVVVGAPFESIDDVPTDNTLRNQGAVYVYQKVSDTWTETKKITQQSRGQNSNFGSVLDVSKDRFIVGARGPIDGKMSASFYVLNESDEIEFENEIFGESTAIDLSVAIGGSHAVLAAVAADNGKVYTFERNSSTSVWQNIPSVYSPNYPAFEDYQYEEFGGALAVSDTDLLIAAPNNSLTDGSGLGYRSGLIYTYKCLNKPEPFTKAFYEELDGSFFRPRLVDVDRDGDLDIFASNGESESRLFRKDNEGYSLVRSFPGFDFEGAGEWLDANADGWPDLVVRHTVNFEYVNHLFLNKRDGTFAESEVTFGVSNDKFSGRLSFADYDNDGDPDLLMQTNDPVAPNHMALLANNGDFTFSDTGITFDGTIQSSQPWSDRNNDGFLDLVTVGPQCNGRLNVYTNVEGESFTKEVANAYAMDGGGRGLPNSGEMLFLDFDNDGDSDIIWSGSQNCTSSPLSSGVIENNDGSFSNSNISLRSSSLWVTMIAGDLDGDGINDFVNLGGRNEPPPGMQVYLGSTTAFDLLQLNEVPRDVQTQGMDAGDIDGDNDLDFFVYGETTFPDTKAMMYVNNSAQGWTQANEAPSVPDGLKLEYVTGRRVKLVWNSSSDDTTPSQAITYNLLLTRNDSVIYNTWSNPDGTRQRSVSGNGGYLTFFPLSNLTTGHYKARVQAIDNSFVGSEFSEELEFFLDLTTGLEDELSADIHIYPVPAKNVLFVGDGREGDLTLSVVDMVGKECLSARTNDSAYQLDISSLAPGVYTLLVKKVDGVIAKRFVKS